MPSLFSGSPTEVNFTATADRTAGDVVVGTDTVFIVGSDTDSGNVGFGYSNGGVFTCDKLSGSGITGGQKMYWSADNEEVDANTAGTFIGYATPDGADSADTTVRIVFAPGT